MRKATGIVAMMGHMWCECDAGHRGTPLADFVRGCVHVASRWKHRVGLRAPWVGGTRGAGPMRVEQREHETDTTPS